MRIEELNEHLKAIGFATSLVEAGGETYLVIAEFKIHGGSRSGTSCSVGIKWTPEVPWVPHRSVHVKPHLVRMGQHSSQASQLGADWQYLSRRFDRPRTAVNFVAHIHTVLGEL